MIVVVCIYRHFSSLHVGTREKISHILSWDELFGNQSEIRLPKSESDRHVMSQGKIQRDIECRGFRSISIWSVNINSLLRYYGIPGNLSEFYIVSVHDRHFQILVSEFLIGYPKINPEIYIVLNYDLIIIRFMQANLSFGL